MVEACCTVEFLMLDDTSSKASKRTQRIWLAALGSYGGFFLFAVWSMAMEVGPVCGAFMFPSPFGIILLIIGTSCGACRPFFGQQNPSC